MRRSLALVIPVLTLLGASSGYAASRRQQRMTCPPAHTRAIAANAQAQVYEATKPPQTFGCVYGSRHAYWLGGPPVYDARGGSERSDFTLGGTFVAFEASTFRDFPEGLPASEHRVVVENLRTGRVLYRVPAGVSSPARVGFGLVTTLLVKSDGAAAWIVGNTEGDSPATTYEVGAVDGQGSRVLGESSEIEPHSLAIAGNSLHWTQGGKAMSTTLN
jgi:hypothetical protein